MHAAQLSKLLAALEEGAGVHWRRVKTRTPSYQVGPHRRDDIVVYQNGRFQAKSRRGVQLLATAHLSVQCPTLRGGCFSYFSLQSGKQVSFKVTALEFLRPLDPNFENLPLGLIKEPGFSKLPKGLVVASKKLTESGQAVLTVEACDGIRLLTAFLEATR